MNPPVLCTLFFLLLSSSDATNCRVGVIGGGAAGLTAAYLLQKQGYSVTVIEKSEEVGGFARTEVVDGRSYDMATMFIPGGGITGEGIEPTLKEMIAVSREKLEPAVDFDTWNVTRGRTVTIPEPLQGIPVAEIRAQLLRGLNLASQLAGCVRTGISCVSCGICETSTERLLAWGERVGVPAFSKYIAYVFDGLGANPAAFTTVPAIISQFAAVDVAYLLRNLGVTAKTAPTGTPANIVSLLRSQRWWFFSRGYQNFWKQLARQARIRVLTSSTVTAMSREDSTAKWHVTLNSGYTPLKFDRVVVTSSPSDAILFLPDGPQKTLIASAISRAPPNDLFLVRTSRFFSRPPRAISFWPEGKGLGSVDLINPAVGGTIKPMFFQKRHKERSILLVATVNLNRSAPVDEVYDKCVTYAADILDIDITKRLYHSRYIFPSVPTDAAAWAAGWATLQGQDGLYFSGEAFSGTGVPAITSFSKRVIPVWFPDVQEF